MLDMLCIQDSIDIIIYSGCCMVTVQRLICTQKCTIGTSETVLIDIREVSLFQRLICTQKCTQYWDLRN